MDLSLKKLSSRDVDMWADTSQCSVAVANMLCSWSKKQSCGAPCFFLGKRPSQPGMPLAHCRVWWDFKSSPQSFFPFKSHSSGCGALCDNWCLRTYGFDFWVILCWTCACPSTLLEISIVSHSLQGIIFPPGLIVLIVFNLSESDTAVLLWLILDTGFEAGWGSPGCHWSQ